MTQNHELKVGEIPSLPSRKSQNCCFNFSQFFIDEQLAALHQLEFKSGAKITAIQNGEKLRGVDRFSPIVDTEILGEENG